jgi:hypothetical protein
MSTNAPVPENTTKRAKPELFRSRTLSVSLTVKDLQKSLAWYQPLQRHCVKALCSLPRELRSLSPVLLLTRPNSTIT